MRKRTKETWKRCPKCGRIENQVKEGYNASGGQRCKYKECGIYYTIDPKRHEYPEETRDLAIKCTTAESAAVAWEKFWG